MEMTLKEKLIKQNKTKWLDIGCNRNFEAGFYYLDIFAKKDIDSKYKERYFEMNILNVSPHKLKRIGRFDFVRMQHVLEHFTYKDGLVVLKNIGKLIRKDGWLLVTVPDLRINIKKYTKNEYKHWEAFKWWAIKMIPEDAPASFYFSVFAYNLPITPHRWCYDYEGLRYLLKKTDLFKRIKRLEYGSPLANFPFTHNRPEEDVCVVVRKR